jgi:hypothetical protein
MCVRSGAIYHLREKKHPLSRFDAFLTSPDATADTYADLNHINQDIIGDSCALARHQIDIVNLAQMLSRSQLLQFFPSNQSEGLKLALEGFHRSRAIQHPHRALSFITNRVLRCHAHHSLQRFLGVLHSNVE